MGEQAPGGKNRANLDLRAIGDALRERIDGLVDLGVDAFPAGGAREESGAPRRERVPAPSPSASTNPAPHAPEAPLPFPQPTLIPRDAETRREGLFAPPAPEVQTLDEIREELGDCTRCKLAGLGRTQIVFGVGSPSAEVVFVGEGPGQDEDIQGIPFVGRAGQLLTKIIEGGMGLGRAEVYICNIVKCRPPQNREPERDEVKACSPFLEKQIRSIHPKVIVALGKPATSTLLGRTIAITHIRGKWQSYLGIPLMPTFHPAYVLRNYTAETRGQVWDDMKEVLRCLGRVPPKRDG